MGSAAERGDEELILSHGRLVPLMIARQRHRDSASVRGVDAPVAHHPIASGWPGRSVPPDQAAQPGVQAVRGDHSIRFDDVDGCPHAGDPATLMQQALNAEAIEEGDSRLVRERGSKHSIEGEPSDAEPPCGFSVGQGKRCEDGRAAAGVSVGDALELPGTRRQHVVEKSQATEHRDTGRHQSLTAGLVTREAGALDDGDVMARARQEQGRRRAAGPGAYDNDTRSAHRRIMPVRP
jgi:hypothetical protein